MRWRIQYLAQFCPFITLTDRPFAWARHEIEIITLESVISLVQFPVSNYGILWSWFHSFEKLRALRVFFDKFTIVEGRNAWDGVHLSVQCSSVYRRLLKFVLLIMGRLDILSRLEFWKDFIYQLHCDHFALSLRVRIRNALQELATLEGELLVVTLFLLFDQIFNKLFAVHIFWLFILVFSFFCFSCVWPSQAIRYRLLWAVGRSLYIRHELPLFTFFWHLRRLRTHFFCRGSVRRDKRVIDVTEIGWSGARLIQFVHNIKHGGWHQ